MAKQVDIEFDRERETTNKQRFREKGGGKKVGVLYVHKDLDKELGKPASLTMTLKAS